MYYIGFFDNNLLNKIIDILRSPNFDIKSSF